MKTSQKLVLVLGVCLLFLLLSIQRVSKNKIITIETSMPSDTLWTNLTNTLKQSSSSSLWPQSYGTVVTQDLQKDSQIFVNFTTITGTYKYSFIITSMQYGVIEYRSNNSSPFPIRGVITVIPREKTSALSWSHEYIFNLFNPIGWYIHVFYIPSLYEALEQQLIT